jgi:O-antigen/teichoic acid export membrane protein
MRQTVKTEDATIDEPAISAQSLLIDRAPSSNGAAIVHGHKRMKQLAIRGSLWTIAGYGASQLLRFGANLILTRILFPEAFGLMAIVMLVLQGLAMFSDVGIGPALIRHPRGHEPDFYNTAWTIQLVRGVVLWLIACLVAVPVASFYQIPLLAQLIPVATFSAAIAGFNSTNLFAESRNLRLGRIICIDLASQFVMIAAMISAAWYWQSVWSLAIGGIIAAAIKALLSHMALPGQANRICWHRGSWKELYSFGRWIFLATLLTFCGSQLDRIVLGRLVPIDLFGAFFIAYALSDVFRNVMTMLSGSVFLPAYSFDERHEDVDVGVAIYPLRKFFLYAFGLLIAFFIAFGDQVIYFLYDPRYDPAAEVLPILIAGLWPRALVFTVGPALFARGRSSYGAMASLLRIIIVGIGMLVLYPYLGPKGVFIAVALADLPQCIVIHYGLRREGMQYGRLNWMATLWTIGCIVLLVSARNWFGLRPVPFVFN